MSVSRTLESSLFLNGINVFKRRWKLLQRPGRAIARRVYLTAYLGTIKLALVIQYSFIKPGVELVNEQWNFENTRGRRGRNKDM